MPPEGSGSQKTNRSSSEEAGQRAIFEQGYDGQAVDQGGQPASDDPDLTLDIPSLGVEELNLDVENLRARISLQAELADMVKLNVGVEADVDKVKLEAKGVEAQLLFKAGLDNVRTILGQALDALDNNPGILEDLFRTSGETSGGTGQRALEGAAGRLVRVARLLGGPAAGDGRGVPAAAGPGDPVRVPERAVHHRPRGEPAHQCSDVPRDARVVRHECVAIDRRRR